MAVAREAALWEEEALRRPQRAWHRELRSIRQRERATTANYVLSLLHDAAYVERAAAIAAPWPLLTNMRAGAWYAPPALVHGTCYFKSTDGHAGTWGFSLTRLNWHVMRLAAECGGVVLVDATRKGKRFPDALSKTVPIWCAVLSALAAAEGSRAAVAGAGMAAKGSDSGKEPGQRARGVDCDGCTSQTEPGLVIDDESAARFLHLPEAVPPSEAAQIRSLIGPSARRLLHSMSPHLRAQLCALLKGRPLVPVWQCPPSELSSADAAAAASMLVRGAASTTGPAAAAAATADSAHPAAVAASGGARAPIVVLCVSASAPVSEAASREQHSWTFIQGAGDDEEAWCRGLRPAAFWQHAGRLRRLACESAGECEDFLDSLRQGGSVGSRAAAHGGLEAGAEGMAQPAAAAGLAAARAGVSAASAPAARDAPANGAHPPASAAGAAKPAAPAAQQPALLPLGTTGILLGAWGAEAVAAALGGGACVLLLGSAAECARAAQEFVLPRRCSPADAGSSALALGRAASGDRPSAGPSDSGPAHPLSEPAHLRPTPPAPPAPARSLLLELGARSGGRATGAREPPDLWVRHILPRALEFARAALWPAGTAAAAPLAGTASCAGADANASAAAPTGCAACAGSAMGREGEATGQEAELATHFTTRLALGAVSASALPGSGAGAADEGTGHGAHLRPAAPAAATRLIIAHGAEVGEAPAVAVALCVLAALFEPRAAVDPLHTGGDVPAAEGADGTAGECHALLQQLVPRAGHHLGVGNSAAGSAAQPVSKQTISDRLVYLQALRAGRMHSQLILPRALSKQINRFFMSPLPPSHGSDGG